MDPMQVLMMLLGAQAPPKPAPAAPPLNTNMGSGMTADPAILAYMAQDHGLQMHNSVNPQGPHPIAARTDTPPLTPASYISGANDSPHVHQVAGRVPHVIRMPGENITEPMDVTGLYSRQMAQGPTYHNVGGATDPTPPGIPGTQATVNPQTLAQVFQSAQPQVTPVSSTPPGPMPQLGPTPVSTPPAQAPQQNQITALNQPAVAPVAPTQPLQMAAQHTIPQSPYTPPPYDEPVNNTPVGPLPPPPAPSGPPPALHTNIAWPSNAPAIGPAPPAPFMLNLPPPVGRMQPTPAPAAQTQVQSPAASSLPNAPARRPTWASSAPTSVSLDDSLPGLPSNMTRQQPIMPTPAPTMPAAPLAPNAGLPDEGTAAQIGTKLSPLVRDQLLDEAIRISQAKKAA